MILRATLGVLLLASEVVHAESGKSFVTLALTKTTDESVAAGAHGKRDMTALSASGAFGVGSNFQVGLKYFDYSYDDSLLADTGTHISGYGPLLGFLHETGVYLQAAYLYQPTKEVKASNGHTKFSGGSGYTLELGKVFEINKSFGVALQLTQSHVSYKEVNTSEAGRQDLAGDWHDESLYPYVAAFVFL